MSDLLPTLQASSERLRALVEGLDPAQLELSAYPTEWSIAQVLSHLGSGAVIALRRLDDGLAGVDSPDDYAPAVWDAWNAKLPAEQAADFLVADRALVERYASLTDDERAAVKLKLGPMELDYELAVGLRLNEHALHSWDVAVALDAGATLPADSTAGIVEHLGLIARFAGKATDAERKITVATTDPDGSYAVELGPEGASFTAGGPTGDADLVLPAEALIRLVYGRLDPDHTPPFEGDGALLDELRRAYPGF